MKVRMNTSVIEIFRNGLMDEQTMNICRKMKISCISDMADLGYRYGSLAKKFGRKSKTARRLQLLVDRAA